MNRRSYLFMPGNNPGMLFSADVLGADMVIFDLEDAVSLEEKDAARDLVSRALQELPFTHSDIAVRINPTDSPYWEEDLRKVLHPNLKALILPKAAPQSLQEVEEALARMPFPREVRDRWERILLIESPRSLLQAEQMLSNPRVTALALGGEDYAAAMGVSRTKGSRELLYARYHLATLGRAYEVEAIDTPFTDLEDQDGFREELEFVKTIGMTGSLVIGPRLVHTVNESFSPDQEAIEEAQMILAQRDRAEREGLGVFSYRGKMVDRPVILRAEQILKRAKEWGLLHE